MSVKYCMLPENTKFKSVWILSFLTTSRGKHPPKQRAPRSCSWSPSPRISKGSQRSYETTWKWTWWGPSARRRGGGKPCSDTTPCKLLRHHPQKSAPSAGRLRAVESRICTKAVASEAARMNQTLDSIQVLVSQLRRTTCKTSAHTRCPELLLIWLTYRSGVTFCYFAQFFKNSNLFQIAEGLLHKEQ